MTRVTEADINDLRNINTSPGPNAGRSIDPTKPGPTADRIVELEGLLAKIANVSSAASYRAELRAELSRLRNEQPTTDTYVEGGPYSPVKAATSSQDVRETVDSETFEEIVHVLTMWRKTERTERWIAQQIVKVLPALAQSSPSQDVRETRDNRHGQELIVALRDGAAIVNLRDSAADEIWRLKEDRDSWRRVAESYEEERLAALAQSDAQPVAWQLVPKELSERMLAVLDCGGEKQSWPSGKFWQDTWIRLLAAAPAPPRPHVSGLIESVARAICKAEGDDPNHKWTLSRGRKDIFGWQDYEDAARAAIEAMPSSRLRGVGGI